MRPLPVLIERRGECNRCGACCVGDPHDGKAPPDVPCPHLRRDADGLASCELHGRADTYWGQGCNVWPSKPEHVAQSHVAGRCSFTFVPRAAEG